MAFQSAVAKAVLDSMSAHVAVLDTKGQILETNAAWKRFARENASSMRPDALKINYLDVCSSALGPSSEEALVVYNGIRDLIADKSEEFVIEYPCHSPDEKRWFYMRATRLTYQNQVFIVVSHENITPLKLVQQALNLQKEALLAREEELKIQTRHLKDANTALKVIMDQREREKEQHERQIVSSIREHIFPCLERLAGEGLDHRQAEWLGLIRSSLDDLLSPFYKKLASLNLQLTPAELEIALMVKEGRSTKEIAAMQGCSTDAVAFHRKNMRRKLGLAGKKVNLRTYLLSLI